MSHGMHLHRVTGVDWRSHRELRLRMLQETPDAYWTTYADVAGRSEADWRRAATGVRSLQARAADGTVLGGCGVLAEPYDDDGSLAADAVNLIAMYVVPPARGTGVGALLLAGAQDATRELGRRRILLEVASNNEAAIRLYLRSGYTFTGATVPHPRRDDLLEREMELRVSGAETVGRPCRAAAADHCAGGPGCSS